MRAGTSRQTSRVCESAPAQRVRVDLVFHLKTWYLVLPLDNNTGFSSVSLTALPNVPSLVRGHHEGDQSVCLERALGKQQQSVVAS